MPNASIERMNPTLPFAPLVRRQTVADSLCKSVTGYAAPHSDRLKNPNRDKNHDHYIQDRLDAGGHGDEVVDQPQHDTHHYQHDDDVQQRYSCQGHFLSLS